MAEDGWAVARVAGLGQHRSGGEASVLMTRGLWPLPVPAWPGRTNHPAPDWSPEKAMPQSCAQSSFSMNLAGSGPRPPTVRQHLDLGPRPSCLLSTPGLALQ